MNVLAIDASTDRLTIAVARDDGRVAGRAEIVHVPRAVGPVFLALRALPAAIFRKLPG